MAKGLTSKQANNFKKSVKELQGNPQPEKAIEKLVNQILLDHYKNKGIPVVNIYPHNTDGVIAVGHGSLFSTIKKNILVEVKQNLNFSDNRKDVSTVLTQVIGYLRKFKNAGDLVPSVTVIADIDEIFIIPTKLVAKYVSNDEYNWSLAPSEMHKDTTLLADIIEDKNIRPYVHDMSVGSFDVRLLCADIDRYLYGNDDIVKTPITKHNMVKLFNDFNFNVFNGDFSQVNNQKQLEIFVRSMKGDDEIYAHPKKTNTLVIDNKEIKPVLLREYEYFWNHYDNGSYTFKELKEITEIFDSALSETNEFGASIRRMNGDFFTPKIWVDKSHEYIESVLGEDWKEKYVVWDASAGTKNLTREYHFNDLYSSTLHKEELSVSADYNKNNVAFQYDFLNDDVELMHGTIRPKGKKALEEWLASRPTADEVLAAAREGKLKLPVDLVEKLYKNKPIVFYMNPPYGQAVDQGGSKKKNISQTAVNKIMPTDYSHAKQELYTQFIYRVQLLAELFDYKEDFHFFFFNKGFLTSPNFNKFTVNLADQFKFNKGFMLNAGEFQGTSSAWGIIFALWSLGGEQQKEFNFNVLQSDKETLEINKITDWKGKVNDKDNVISNWLKEIELSKEPSTQNILTKNGFDIPTSNSTLCKLQKGWIGYAHNNGNNIQFSEKYIGLYSLGFSSAHGRDITKDNFTRIAVTFSIRRSVQEQIAKQKLLWVRDKDIFTRPSEDLLTQEFINDCVIYSLFDRQSNQTSLRDYEYNDKTYQVYNEFFPYSRDFIKELAVKHHNMAIQIDLDNDNRKQRFVYEWLQDKELSQEAQDLYDYVKELIKDSFKDRHTHNVIYPRYQTNNWDQGWLSIRTMIFGRDRINDNYLDKKPEFDKRLRALGDKIANAAIADGVI